MKKRNGKATQSTTPVRAALKPTSSLRPLVQDGLGAVKPDLRDLIAEDTKSQFADSLDLDGALKAAFPKDHRWDYLLGDGATRRVVAVEAHTAHQKEVSVVIAKRKSARAQLQAHLAPGAVIADWIWVSAGKVGFLQMEKTTLLLSQNGIAFAGRQLQAKHLPRGA